MNAIDLLTQRQSHSLLQAPAPSEQDLTLMLQAAVRVPDHGALTPWHFTIVQGEGLDKLSQIFSSAIADHAVDDAKRAKTAKMPYRAPMIIVISTQVKKHDKVPKQEQVITASCAAHAMQMAAFTLGYGAIWRTGELSYNSVVKEQLNVKENDEIVGFLYVGTKCKELALKPAKNIDDFISYL